MQKEEVQNSGRGSQDLGRPSLTEVAKIGLAEVQPPYDLTLGHIFFQ